MPVRVVTPSLDGAGDAPSARLAGVLRGIPQLATAEDVAKALQDLVARAALALPLPGSGATAARFHALAELGARDLSLARLAEGHVDAVAILAEAGREPLSGCYGVWAAEPPEARVAAERTREGWRLRGTKRYASGARGLQRALVTATADDGVRLFDVDLLSAGVRPVPGTWNAVGMAATESLDVTFEDVEVTAREAVGKPGFYLARPGFWRGAVGVAACWYGGALGAFRMLSARLAEAKECPHHLAHLGAMAAACASMRAVLDAAATAIDAEARAIATGRSGRREDHDEARTRALIARQVVEQGCQEVLTRAGRASGSAALVFDRAHAQRAADLVVYLRQHHAERDLEALGRAILDPETPC